MPPCETCGAWKDLDAVVLVEEDGRQVIRCRSCQYPPSAALLAMQAEARARFRVAK